MPAPTRPSYTDALARLDVLAALQEFEPRLAGTPPLGLDVASSDIDVLCHAPDPARFTDAIWEAFSSCDRFAVWQWTGPRRPVVARFAAAGWEIELYGDPRPVAVQEGWRHFEVERRLLTLGGAAFRAAVMRRREAGAKTEPAFAAVLGLTGDPYGALLDLADADDDVLRGRLHRAGFAPTRARP